MLLILQLNNLLSTSGAATGVCQIVEFIETQGKLSVPKGVNAVQNISYNQPTASQPMSEGTKIARVIADADVYLDLNGNTATANSLKLNADKIEYFGVEKGQIISCYDGSS